MVAIENAETAPAMSASPFARAADALIAAGFHIIPVIAGAKEPGVYQGAIGSGRWTLAEGWNGYARQAPSPASIERWSTWPDSNIGIVLGTPVGGYQVIVLDLDTSNQDELDMLRSQLPPSPMMKRGARGFSAFYRADKAVRTKRYAVPAPTPDKPTAKRTVLEILTGNAPKQTVVPPSLHPEGMDYEWLTGEGIVPAHELPVLEDHHFEALEDTLAHLGWAGDIAAPVRDRANRDTDDPNIWRETNDAGMANLDAWAAYLQLPKLKRHPNGAWEAVPNWRSSNEGRPTMQRKPNLKMHPTGIKDMGTDVGYTPLDVVQAAFGWDFDEAFNWLRGRLGLNIGEAVIPELTEYAGGALCDEATGEIIPPVAAARARSRDFPDHLTRVPGLLGEMVEYVVDTARQPDRTLALGSALVCLGTIIGRRDATPTGSGTHLYVIALAGSGGGKDHPQAAGKTLLRVAGSERPGTKLVGASEFMSQSAMIREMQARPLRASFIDEFGDFLKKVNARNAPSFERGLKTILLTSWGRSFDVYETPAWAHEASEDVFSPAYSIFGASTPGKFYDALQGDDRENGFLNRMLLLPTFTRRDAGEPAYDYRNVPDGLEASLRAAHRVRRPQIENNPLMNVIDWEDEDAKASYLAFKAECLLLAGETTYFARSAEMATRLATIRAVGRNVEFPAVSIDDIVWGIEVARWSAQRMTEDAGAFVADTQVGRDRARIMKKLKDSPEGRVPKTKVMQDLGFSSKDIAPLIKDLVEFGDLREGKITPASGGKTKHFLIAT